MKRIITALVAGIALGSTGLGVAASQGDTWVRHNVLCTTTGKGQAAGVVCSLLGPSQKVAVVNQKQILVGNGGKLIYMTSSR